MASTSKKTKEEVEEEEEKELSLETKGSVDSSVLFQCLKEFYEEMWPANDMLFCEIARHTVTFTNPKFPWKITRGFHKNCIKKMFPNANSNIQIKSSCNYYCMNISKDFDSDMLKAHGSQWFAECSYCNMPLTDIKCW